jgi:ATP-dependent RNA helicase DeaD
METNSSNEAGTSPSTTGETVKLTHTYFEVGNDVLAKPGSLCDLVELHGSPATAVFCNSPSDADLVDVVLKKRGISSEKLVGHIPPMRISKAVKQVKSGEICVIVVTDVSGASIDTEELDLVINYSLPSEPEVYLHRCGQTRPGQRLKNVLSLINPLDLTNLHFLKKVVDFPIEKGELPSKEQLGGQTLKKLIKQAVEAAPTFESRITELTDQVLADKDAKAVIGLLLRNTLDVLPAAQAMKSSESRPEGDGYRGGRGDRGERGGDRGDRGDRGGERSNRDGGRRRGGRNDEMAAGGDESFGGDDGFRRERRPSMPPPEKHHRLYIGEGSKNGLTKEKLSEAITAQAGVQTDAIKNIKIRPNYTFVDGTEEASELVLTAFDVTSGKGKLFARRATTVSAPHSGGGRGNDNMNGDEMGGNDSSKGGPNVGNNEMSGADDEAPVSA